MQNKLFNDLRNSILNEAQNKENKYKKDNSVVDSVKDAETRIDKITNIQPSDMLFTMWKEWTDSCIGNQNSADLVNIDKMTVDFNASDFDKVNMSCEEITSEKKRLETMLMLKAKKHYRATRKAQNGDFPNIDAEIFVHVSMNRMAAWIFAFPPTGNGSHLDRESFELALMECSVVAGIEEDVIGNFINKPRYFELILVAHGIEPTESVEADIIEYFPRKIEKKFTEDEKGNLNFYSQFNTQEIHKGDIICELKPAKQGENGINVIGVPIVAKTVKNERLSGGQNTAITEDGLFLKATIDGHLVYRGGCFQVEPTYYVKGDVDLGIGNINFLGDVEILGDVRDNFVIQAGGSVKVHGIVEGAIIEAGKDVTVVSGISGNGKAVIKAGGDVISNYIESTFVLSGGNVIAGAIIGSEIYCDNTVECRVGRGTIIGGKIVVGYSVNATIIGNRAERNTFIAVGQTPYRDSRYREIEAQLEDAERELEVIEKTLNKIDKIDTDELIPELSKVAADYRLKKAVITMKVSHLDKEVESLKDVEMDKSKLFVCANIIYPITEVHILESALKIKEKSSGFNRLHLEGDEIVVV